MVSTSLAAVITAASAVEAVVNELFLERAEFDQSCWFPGLSDKLATGSRSHGLNPTSWGRIRLNGAPLLTRRGRAVDCRGAAIRLGLGGRSVSRVA